MFDFIKEREAFENKVWLSSPTMHGPELEYIKEAYETNWMSTVGANINEVERLASEKVGCKYAVALSAGTAALHMAVKLAGVKPGDKVFCSDMTFDATVNPVVYEGGVPVFIDTEYDTWNMDPVALEKAFVLYPEVKVVVTAHLYGTPGKVDEIRNVCEKHNAILIEDAAESLGATYKGKQTGQFGDFNAISFNGNKIITGSAVTLDDRTFCCKVQWHDIDIFSLDVLPDIGFCPVRNWEYTDTLSLMNLGIIKFPHLRSLILRIPRMVLITEREDSFFGTGLFLVTTSTTKCSSKSVFIQCLL